MRWFSSILDRLLPLKADTLVLGGADAWMVTGGVDPERGRDLIGLLRGAVELFGSDAILYLEGTAMAPEVKSALAEWEVQGSKLLPRATRWPRADVLHVPLRMAVIEALANGASNRPPQATCNHLHIYRGDDLLLQGFEVGWEPFLISMMLPEAKVADFCGRTGFSYERSSAI